MNRTLFALAPFALVCASFAPGLLSPAPAAASESSPRYLLGRLTEQHVRVCAGGEERWEHAHYEAGFVWLLPEPGVDLSPLVGKPVLLEGEPAAPCPRRPGSPIPASARRCRPARTTSSARTASGCGARCPRRPPGPAREGSGPIPSQRSPLDPSESSSSRTSGAMSSAPRRARSASNRCPSARASPLCAVSLSARHSTKRARSSSRKRS